MSLRVRALELPEVLELTPTIHPDPRGHFFELWRADGYAAVGLPAAFVQDNVSRSRRGVIRGLHAQFPVEQGKLVTVLRGAIFDVAVDARRGSPRFGRWAGATLRADEARQLWVPPGFLHGFQALEDDTVVLYKVTGPYDRPSEVAVRWDDLAIGIQWPLSDQILSTKDEAAPTLDQLPAERLPVFRPSAG